MQFNIYELFYSIVLYQNVSVGIAIISRVKLLQEYKWTICNVVSCVVTP